MDIPASFVRYQLSAVIDGYGVYESVFPSEMSELDRYVDSLSLRMSAEDRETFRLALASVLRSGGSGIEYTLGSSNFNAWDVRRIAEYTFSRLYPGTPWETVDVSAVTIVP